jgi:hypothetical protein
MVGQDAPNDIFIQRNTESQSDLLGDSGATPFGIPPFGIDNGIDEFFRRSFGTRFLSAFWRKKDSILSVLEGVVEIQ